MADIKWLFNLEYAMFKNRYWRDRATRSRTFIGLSVIVAFMYLLTQLLYRSFSFELDTSSVYYNAIVFMVFFVVVIWICFMSFIQGLSHYTKVFYKSPEMNHLLTLPIPFNSLFLFSFFKLIIMSNKSMLLLYVPFVSTIGLHIDASFMYYILIIPVYFVITIIPSSLAVLVALIGVKFLSNKAFSLLTTFAALGLNVGFAMTFTRSSSLFERFYPQIVSIFERQYILDLFPMTAAARLLMSISNLKVYHYSIVFYMLITLIVLIVSVVISKRLYFKGWEKSQIVEVGEIKKNQTMIKEKKYNKFHLILHWMKIEWKMASRNYDMFIASLSMLSFYILAVLAFSFGNIFSDDSIVVIALLILISTIFNVMAISLLFLPPELSKDKSLWKDRFWMLKVLPLSGNQVLLLQSLMYFIPAYGISLSGLVIYAVFNGVSILVFLAASLVMFILLYGASLVYVATELLSISKFFEKNAQIGNLITIVLPLLYAILSTGLFTLIVSKTYLSNIKMVYDIANSLSLTLTILISISAFLSAVFYAKKSFVFVWNELEI